jgi:hypothetical protein
MREVDQTPMHWALAGILMPQNATDQFFKKFRYFRIATGEKAP